MNKLFNFRPLMLLSLTASVFISIAPLAQGAVTLTLTADVLKDGVGNPLSTNSLYLLIADKDNDGFDSLVEGFDTTLNSIVGGDDDTVIFRSDLLINETPGLILETIQFQNDELINYGLNGGEQLALMWFPDLTIDSNSLLAGTSYGLYPGWSNLTDASETALDGSADWVFPNDGSTVDLIFLTNDSLASGSNLHTSADANLTVAAVPELQNIYLPVMIGLSAIFLRQRKSMFE